MMKDTIKHADSTIDNAVEVLSSVHKSLESYHRKVNKLKIMFAVFVAATILFGGLFVYDVYQDKNIAENYRVELCEQSNDNTLGTIGVLSVLRDVVIAQGSNNPDATESPEDRKARIDAIFESVKAKSLEENPLLDCDSFRS